MEWCNGTELFNMSIEVVGTGGCTPEGSLTYNNVSGVYEFCDGSGWLEIPGVVVDPSINFLDSGKNEVGTTTTTYNSIGFGTAKDDRIVAVAISYRKTASSTMASPLNSVTIGGVSATQAIAAAASQRTASSIWYANVPSGTTGTIVLNSPDAIASAISVYRLIDVSSSTPNDTDSSGSTGTVNTLSNTVNIQDKGVGVCSAANANDTDTINWSGTGITKNTNIQNAASNDHQHSSALVVNSGASAANRTYTASWSGGEYSSQVCSVWR